MTKRLLPLTAAALVLLILAAAAITIVVTPASATWSVNYASVSESRISGPRVAPTTLRFRNSVAKFVTRMQSDRDVFPGSCVSNQPNASYGWDRYKTKIIRRLSVSVNQNAITIALWPVMGFAINVTETVTCGPFKNKFGEPYWLGDTIAEEDAHFTFSIQPSITHVALYSVVLPKVPLYVQMPIPDLAKDSNQMHEGDVRDEGLQFFIVLGNDNWNPDKISEIAALITCQPAACLSNFTSLMSVTLDAVGLPNVINVTLTREQMRLFDISAVTTVRFSLPNNGRGFGLVKDSSSIEMPPASNSFLIIPGFGSGADHKPVVSLGGATLAVDPVTGAVIRRIVDPSTRRVIITNIQHRLVNNTMHIDENCLRGKTALSRFGCNRTLLFFLPLTPPTQIHRFLASTARWRSDLQQHTLTSSFPSKNNFSDLPWLEGWETDYRTMSMITLAPLPAYDTAKIDTITITLPFGVFSRREHPIPSGGAPLRLVVSPSPGTLVASLRDVHENEIWKSHQVLHLTLDGEAWRDEVVSQNLLLDRLTFGGGSSSQQQLETQQLVESVTFVQSEYYPEGVVNRSVIAITLRWLPLLSISSMEVTASINNISSSLLSSWTESDLPLTNDLSTINQLTSFKILKAPAEFFVVQQNSSNVSSSSSSSSSTTTLQTDEQTIQHGGFQMDLIIVGDRWTIANLAICKHQLCHSFFDATATTSSSSSSTTAAPLKPNSFLDLISKGHLCDSPSAMQLVAPVENFTASQQTMRMTLSPAAHYNTRSREIIGIRIPGVCTLSGLAPAAGWNTNLTILPTPALGVDFELFLNSTSSSTTTTTTTTSLAVPFFRESVIRNVSANNNFYTVNVCLRGDSWELGVNRTEVLASMTSSSDEVMALLLNEQQQQQEQSATAGMSLVMAGTCLAFGFKPMPTFDIPSNQTVTLRVQPQWTASGRAPSDPVASFLIVSDAPDITTTTTSTTTTTTTTTSTTTTTLAPIFTKATTSSATSNQTQNSGGSAASAGDGAGTSAAFDKFGVPILAALGGTLALILVVYLVVAKRRRSRSLADDDVQLTATLMHDAAQPIMSDGKYDDDDDGGAMNLLGAGRGRGGGGDAAAAASSSSSATVGARLMSSVERSMDPGLLLASRQQQQMAERKSAVPTDELLGDVTALGQLPPRNSANNDDDDDDDVDSIDLEIETERQQANPLPPLSP